MLGSAGGTVLYNDQSSLGRAVYYTNGTYRTILSAVVFGALHRTLRNELLQGIVEWLTTGSGVAELRPVTAGERLSIAPNPAPRNGRVRLTLPSGYTGPVRVFDATGRSVLSAVCDLQSAIVLNLPAGGYVLRAAGQSVPFAVVR